MATETITWVDPDGNETTFVDMRGITGRGLPPVSFFDDPIPGLPGSAFRSVRDNARQIVLPILLSGADRAAYRTAMRALAASLHPSTTPGTLRVDTVDGLVREATCWYIDGLGLVEEYPDWSTPSLLFKALDPYWYDDNDTDMTWANAAATAFFPIFPLVLSSSAIVATTTVTVAGQVPVWPTWQFTGPFTGVRLTRGTSVFQLDYEAADGEVVTLDTRAKTVTDPDDVSLFGSVVRSTIFRLEPGDNDVTVEAVGGTEDTTVLLRYRAGWLSV